MEVPLEGVAPKIGVAEGVVVVLSLPNREGDALFAFGVPNIEEVF